MIEVNQIYFRPEQTAFLDPAFIPYDNSHNEFPEQMEFRVFLDNFETGKIKSDLTGFLSWKFGAKTKIQGSKFLQFIESRPGFETYFVNPYPGEWRFKNTWVQGERYHAGLLEFAQKAFLKAGYEVILADLEEGPNSATYCNYWVGTRQFWQRFIAFSKPLYDYLITRSSPEERAFLWSRADKRISASYFPFIFERMYSLFLTLHPEITRARYRFTNEELDTHSLPRDLNIFVRVAQRESNNVPSKLLKASRQILKFRQPALFAPKL